MHKWSFLSMIVLLSGFMTACNARFHAYTPPEGSSSKTTTTTTQTTNPNRTTGVTYTQGPGTIYSSPPTTPSSAPSSTPSSTPSAGSTPTNPQPTYPVENQSDKLTCAEAQFVRLLNIYRNKNGRSSLSVSLAGVRSSRWHAQDMINKNYFSHTEPDGRDFSSRAAHFGYSAWAENIAAGSSTAAGSFCQWKNSPGHNTNMLSSQHSSMGIGNIGGGGSYGTYWSNNFGPQVNDAIQEPLTTDSGCAMPTSLPGC